MSDQQLSLFTSPRPGYGSDRGKRSYVRQGSERPADLARLDASAETMEARVLAWFQEGELRFRRTGFSEDVAYTPTQCAFALCSKITSIRPRITQLVRSGHLERCAWLTRKPTEDGGSEGWFRFREGSEE